MARNINRNPSTDAWVKWPCWHEGKRCWCTKNTRTCTNRLRGNYIRDFSGGSEEEKYSNWTEGYFRAMGALMVLGIYGIYSLYKFGQGDKKHIQIVAGLVGTGLISKNLRKKG